MTNVQKTIVKMKATQTAKAKQPQAGKAPTVIKTKRPVAKGQATAQVLPIDSLARIRANKQTGAVKYPANAEIKLKNLFNPHKAGSFRHNALVLAQASATVGEYLAHNVKGKMPLVAAKYLGRWVQMGLICISNV